MDHRKIRKFIQDKRGYRTLEGFDGLMRTKNTRASQSPLHSEIDALIWTMEIVFCYFCNGLFSVGEYGFGTKRMVSLCKLFGRHTNLEEKFNSSELIHIPQTQNSRTYSLARSARKQLSFVVHIDAELPVWFA